MLQQSAISLSTFEPFVLDWNKVTPTGALLVREYTRKDQTETNLNFFLINSG